MIILLLYVVPALWLGILLSLWLGNFLAGILAFLPDVVLVSLHDNAGALLLVGLLFALIGNGMLMWEITSHRNFPRNLDALLIYTGAGFVVWSYLVSPQWVAAMGTVLGTLLIAPHACASTLRIMMRFTRTAPTSVLFFAGYIGALFVLSWLTVFMLG
jgi:hypothetical protein